MEIYLVPTLASTRHGKAVFLSDRFTLNHMLKVQSKSDYRQLGKQLTHHDKAVSVFIFDCFTLNGIFIYKYSRNRMIDRKTNTLRKTADNRPFHGFFNFSHGPVSENPSTPLERAP